MGTSSLRDSEGSRQRHDAVWSDQRKEDSHEHVRDAHDQCVDFHWNGGANQFQRAAGGDHGNRQHGRID
jgi:hypothetical protein